MRQHFEGNHRCSRLVHVFIYVYNFSLCILNYIFNWLGPGVCRRNCKLSFICMRICLSVFVKTSGGDSKKSVLQVRLGQVAWNERDLCCCGIGVQGLERRQLPSYVQRGAVLIKVGGKISRHSHKFSYVQMFCKCLGFDPPSTHVSAHRGVDLSVWLFHSQGKSLSVDVCTLLVPTLQQDGATEVRSSQLLLDGRSENSVRWIIVSVLNDLSSVVVVNDGTRWNARTPHPETVYKSVWYMSVSAGLYSLLYPFWCNDFPSIPTFSIFSLAFGVPL